MKSSKIERRYVSEFVYGGIDGAVTTFAIVAGSLGAALNSSIILVLGAANLLADGFSMAVSNYLSTKSEKELHRKHKHENLLIKNPKKTAIATFISFAVIGFIPIFPFVLALFIPSASTNQFLYSAILTAFAFLFIGSMKGRIVEKSISKSAIETLAIGGVAAVIAFAVGYLLRGLVG
jgi:vacuolar iron transporter family protein